MQRRSRAHAGACIRAARIDATMGDDCPLAATERLTLRLRAGHRGRRCCGCFGGAATFGRGRRGHRGRRLPASGRGRQPLRRRGLQAVSGERSREAASTDCRLALSRHILTTTMAVSRPSP